MILFRHQVEHWLAGLRAWRVSVDPVSEDPATPSASRLRLRTLLAQIDAVEQSLLKLVYQLRLGEIRAQRATLQQEEQEVEAKDRAIP